MWRVDICSHLETVSVSWFVSNDRTTVDVINIIGIERYHLMPPKTMSKLQQHSYAMTLRLQNAMADEIENIAFSLNLSRAAFVRRSIRRAIEHARQHELPLLNKQVLEAIRP
jgi:hypothetical protein